MHRPFWVTFLMCLIGGCLSGAQGPQGAQGVQGLQGVQGPAGVGIDMVDGGDAFGVALDVGPVDLRGTVREGALNIEATAVGSGVNGPQTAQNGLIVQIEKDNWYSGPAAVGEVDGEDILVRQNGPGSDCSGLLIDVANEGTGFLSATEFSTTVVDPVTGTQTYGIDVQEGVLDVGNADYLGAVYTAENGQLGTGVLIQDSPDSGWSYAIQYTHQGEVLFSVDGTGAVVAPSVYTAGVALNGDPANGTIDLGNLANAAATPYLSFNGFGDAGNVRIINDAPGQLTIDTASPQSLQVNAEGVYSAGGFRLNLSTPSSSRSPCTVGQIGADESFVYVCTAANTWKRAALSAF